MELASLLLSLTSLKESMCCKDAAAEDGVEGEHKGTRQILMQTSLPFLAVWLQ